MPASLATGHFTSYFGSRKRSKIPPCAEAHCTLFVVPRLGVVEFRWGRVPEKQGWSQSAHGLTEWPLRALVDLDFIMIHGPTNSTFGHRQSTKRSLMTVLIKESFSHAKTTHSGWQHQNIAYKPYCCSLPQMPGHNW